MKKEIVYAIKHKNSKDYYVSFGKSVIGAWRSAEQGLGETAEKLQEMGYKLVKGTWNEQK